MAGGQDAWWADLPNGVVPPWSWQGCIWKAAVRLSVAINSERFPRSAEFLGRDDAALCNALWGAFPQPRFKFVRTRVEAPAGASDEHTENDEFFYPRLTVDRIDSGRRLTHVATHAFLRATYRGLFPRDGETSYAYTLRQLGFSEADDPYYCAETCGINYLVKNLAHNYVHVAHQEINDTNYHYFAGAARYQSDFAADNWATILLAASYGVPLVADSTEANTIDDKTDTAVVRMLRRNRCNQAFRERAVIRAEAIDETDLEWRLRREIAVYLGGWFVAVGRVAASLAIYISDETGAELMSTSGVRLNRNVIAEINGSYFRYEAPLPRPFFDRGNNAAGQEASKKSLRDYYRHIARSIDHRYRELLHGDVSRRHFASETLRAGLSRLGAAP